MSLFGRAEKAENAALKARIDQLLRERNAALEDAATERAAKKTAVRLVDERDNQVLRLGQMLTREVVDGQAGVGAAGLRAERYRLAWESARRRGREAREEADAEFARRIKAEKHATDQATPPSRSDQEMRRLLFLSEQARARLDEQLGEVQRANDALNREAVDRAGTLATREAL